MKTVMLSDEVRHACRVHARLLDRFIEATRVELEKTDCAFTQESLGEFLETLRSDRRIYGAIAGLVTVENAA